MAKIIATMLKSTNVSDLISAFKQFSGGEITYDVGVKLDKDEIPNDFTYTNEDGAFTYTNQGYVENVIYRGDVTSQWFENTAKILRHFLNVNRITGNPQEVVVVMELFSE